MAPYALSAPWDRTAPRGAEWRDEKDERKFLNTGGFHVNLKSGAWSRFSTKQGGYGALRLIRTLGSYSATRGGMARREGRAKIPQYRRFPCEPEIRCVEPLLYQTGRVWRPTPYPHPGIVQRHEGRNGATRRTSENSSIPAVSM